MDFSHESPMADVKFQVWKAIDNIVDGTTSSDEFQEEIDTILSKEEGANWFTVCLGTCAVLGDYGYSEDDKYAVIKEFLDIFERENVEQTFGQPDVESAIKQQQT